MDHPSSSSRRRSSYRSPSPEYKSSRSSSRYHASSSSSSRYRSPPSRARSNERTNHRHRRRSRSCSRSRSRSRSRDNTSSSESRERRERRHRKRKKKKSSSSPTSALNEGALKTAEMIARIKAGQEFIVPPQHTGNLTSQQFHQLILSRQDNNEDDVKTGPVVPDYEAITEAMEKAGDDPMTLARRELFVGNVPIGTCEFTLQSFLNNCMQQVNLTTMPGDPILKTRINGKFAFCTLRSIDETDAMLHINGVPFESMALRLSRPAKYTGPITHSKSWQEVSSLVSSTVIRLEQMVTLAEVKEDEDYQDIYDDIKEECGRFGVVDSIVIPRTVDSPGAEQVFVAFATVDAATLAIASLGGRSFSGRAIVASFYSESKYAAKDFEP